MPEARCCRALRAAGADVDLDFFRPMLRRRTRGVLPIVVVQVPKVRVLVVARVQVGRVHRLARHHPHYCARQQAQPRNHLQR